jgi:hypothetical protein
MVHGRLSQDVPIDIPCRLCDIQPAANGAASEQQTHGHEAEGQALVLTSRGHIHHAVQWTQCHGR